jgi:hypothetical protein
MPEFEEDIHLLLLQVSTLLTQRNWQMPIKRFLTRVDAVLLKGASAIPLRPVSVLPACPKH